uniref:Uncharacterized protein n=1 Tax=Anguilla anguilla TaxID=7936 RepID=A0A0E9R815_ANGAN
MLCVFPPFFLSELHTVDQPTF